MKKIFSAMTLIALLSVAVSASAKEISAATVCGSTGCNSSDDPSSFVPLLEGGWPPTAAPAQAVPFFRVRVTVDDGQAQAAFAILVAPRAGVMRGPEGDWRTLSKAGLAEVRRAAAGLQPFPASQLARLLEFESSPLQEGTPSESPASASALDHDGSSFPWAVVAAAATAVLLVSALALGLRLPRGKTSRA